MTGRSGPSVGRNDILKKMLDYTISTFYPHLQQNQSSDEEKYLKFYEEVKHLFYFNCSFLYFLTCIALRYTVIRQCRIDKQVLRRHICYFLM